MNLTSNLTASGYLVPFLAYADIAIDVSSGDPATLLQAALNQSKANGRRSTRVRVISNGAFALNAGILVDPYYHDVDFMGAVVTYIPTTGTAITVQGTTVNAFSQGVGGIKNINLIGASGVSDSTRGIYFVGSAAETRTSSMNENISIYGFNVGLELKDYAFITHFRNLTITNFRNFGFIQSAGSDAGENVTITNGVIANGIGVGLYTQGVSELYTYGLSIDYNGKAVETTGKIEMHGGHIELNGITGGQPASADQIKVSGNGSSFRMFGGVVLVNTRNGAGPFGYAYFANPVDAGSHISFHGTRLINVRNVDDIFVNPAALGRFHMPNPEFYTNSVTPYRWALLNNQLIDGGGEGGSIQDFFYVAGSGGSITSRYTDSAGLAITSATDVVDSGSRSIKIARAAVGTGYTQQIALAVPVQHLRSKRLWMYLRARSTLGAPAVWTLSFAALRTLDANNRPTWDRKSAYATNFYLTTVPDAWTTILINNGFAEIPPWATHVTLDIDITPGASASALWLDGVSFEAY